MNAPRMLYVSIVALLTAVPLAAQSGPTAAEAGPATVAPAPERIDAATLRSELLALREVFETQADALAAGLLPTTLDPNYDATAMPAAGGGGAVGALGTISSALGPLSTSIASLTFERDPELSNGTSETFAAIGLGTSVLGGILNLVAGGGGDDEMATAAASAVYAARAAGEFRETQGAAERLIADLEDLAGDAESLAAGLEAGAIEPSTRQAALSVLRRGERATLRYDYLTRSAVSQLASLRAGADVAPGVDGERRRSEIGLAESRLHGALEAGRTLDIAMAFSRMGALRDRLSD